MADSLAWGILGTGSIARTFARGVAESRMGTLAAVGSRTQESADRFGGEFGVERRHPTYEALLGDPEVEAVYISTPHPMHAEWAIKAADAGKHVLCEKPLTLNHAEAMAVTEAALRNDVFLMEAFMYRCHPYIARLRQLIAEGAIGEVRVIHATFAFDAGYNPDARLFANALGGGGILDVGGYTTSMARLVAGMATGVPFADPVEVEGVARLGEETRTDEWSVASLKFPGDVVAQLSCAVRCSQENVVRIYGSEGDLLVTNPWVPGEGNGSPKIAISHKGDGVREETIDAGVGVYALEADAVADHLEERQAPQMSWEDSLGNMRALDAWREAVGLVYDAEQPGAGHPPVHGRPLRVRRDSPMQYGEIPGVGKRVSRLVMGCDNQRTMPHAAVMWDDWYEQGGNVFDTGYIYGGGLMERLLGQWVRDRGVREQVVIIGKGAHTPFNTPEHADRQLLETLDRLQTEYVDLYVFHRDNPDVPVGEWVDLMNGHIAAGRVRVYGGSNWSIERVDASNEYARANGKQGVGVLSNNFSLARMVEPVWAGCVAASDPDSRAWLQQTQIPLLPWSSQARGFFTERAGPEKRSDPELVRSWYSDDNFERRRRAIELAERRGVPPIQVALAYVLAQPFPTFPLIGPRALSETRTSLPALAIHLSPEEVRWLNLED